MKKLTIILCAALVACSTTQTAFDYDTSANFANYKTYAFTPETDELGVDQLNKDRIIKAVEAELAAKGFTKSETPDVLVDIHLKTQQRVEAVANTTGSAYRYGYYGGVGMSTTTINYNEYTDGSLFISIVDHASGKLAWQGVGTKTIDENMSPEKREQNINYAVKQIMMNYPPKKK